MNLKEIQNDCLTGEMLGKQWCSIPKSNFDWLIQQVEEFERYKKYVLYFAGKD